MKINKKFEDSENKYSLKEIFFKNPLLEVKDSLVHINELLTHNPMEKTPFRYKLKESIENNPPDILSMCVPLFLRLLEWAKEDAPDDVALHVATENIVKLASQGKTLRIGDYESIVGSDLNPPDKIDEAYFESSSKGIEVSLRDARKAQEIFNDVKHLYKNIKMSSTNVYSSDNIDQLLELLVEFEDRGLEAELIDLKDQEELNESKCLCNQKLKDKIKNNIYNKLKEVKNG